MLWEKVAFFLFCFLIEDFIYFWREGEGGKKRERNITVWLPLTPPHWGPGPQPRRVPWPGIKLATLWFTGRCSIHWATPARAEGSILKVGCFSLDLMPVIGHGCEQCLLGGAWWVKLGHTGAESWALGCPHFFRVQREHNWGEQSLGRAWLGRDLA